VVDGDFTPLMVEDPQIWAYIRASPDGKLLVIANFGRGPRTVQIGPEWIGVDLVLGNLPGTPATPTSTSLDLTGWDARIYSQLSLAHRRKLPIIG
jgi:oligo-1,6-glucosidase